MTHLSLFSGIGGIDLASHWAGFETVQFVERDQFCQKVLAKNFPGVPIHDDVTTFDGRPFAGRTDLISAGFPCPPHSLAGKRLASGDERDLWSEVVRVLGETKPRWFLGENVSGILSSEHGQFFGRMLNDLASLGYRAGWCVYGASSVGAIHPRRRVFIVAHSDSFRVQRLPKIKIQRKPGLQGREDVGRVEGFPRMPDLHQPALCNSSNGVPNFVARLKALGNAVCPQQIYPVLKAIAEASK